MQIPKQLELSVTTPSLAFAIMKAHRSGKSIEVIERLLCCPAADDGLTGIKLRERTWSDGVKELVVELHVDTTVYEISINPTTDEPQNYVVDLIAVDRQGASRPCFRTAPIAITTGKKAIFNLPVSLLLRDNHPLTSTQQNLLLQTLVPDLPLTSPLLSNNPPFEIAVQTIVRQDRIGQPFVTLRLCFVPTDSVHLNRDFIELDFSLQGTGYPFKIGETKPYRYSVWDIDLRSVQMLVASIHAIQHILVNTPEWQILGTAGFPHAYIFPCDPADLNQLLSYYSTLRLNQVHPHLTANNRIACTSEHRDAYPHLECIITEHYPAHKQSIPSFSFAHHKQLLYSHMCNLYSQQAHKVLSC